MIWLWLLPAVLGLALALEALALPAATLFAALAVGLAVATGRKGGELAVPPWARVSAQACLGTVIGALVQPDIMQALAREWLPVLAAVVVTLVISVLSGLVLSLRRDVDRITGSFALVAGGAAGVTGLSRELGADQQVVAVVQYLRVLVITLTIPAVVALLPSNTAAGTAPEPATLLGAGEGDVFRDLAFALACTVLGVLGARALRMPAGPLLGPLVLAAVLTSTGVAAGAQVPAVLERAAFVVIGLQVGLSFTRRSVRAVRSVLPGALALVAAMTIATAALGIPLLQLTGASVLDAYLATTPGGLYAVLATAADLDVDTTLVATVQVLRLLVVLMSAPMLAALVSRKHRPPDPPAAAPP